MHCNSLNSQSNYIDDDDVHEILVEFLDFVGENFLKKKSLKYNKDCTPAALWFLSLHNQVFSLSSVELCMVNIREVNSD